VRKNFWGLIIATLFFVVGVATLSDYGINVDEPAHFIRGQAYAELLLTGRKDYSSEVLTAPRVSVWKFPLYNGYFYLNKDTGHPPLNGILAAITNRVFYEKFGLLGDLESYHLFEIFVASLGVGVLFLFVYESFGITAAIFSAIFFFSLFKIISFKKKNFLLNIGQRNGKNNYKKRSGGASCDTPKLKTSVPLVRT